MDLSSGAAEEARRIVDALAASGFVAYLAGGCVRDALMGKQPKDYDVATDATPEAIRKVFGKSKTVAFGASFGVIGVLPPSKKSLLANSAPVEVATFRSDGTYSDGRRPDRVHFGSAAADALRRDFTINGLFYDPIRENIIDYIGGQHDLSEGILRTIGDPFQRFAEDKLRMLRAVRFVTTSDFQLESATADAIREKAHEITVVSGERIGVEMRRTMSSRNCLKGLNFLRSLHLHHAVMPELEAVDVTLLENLLQEKTDRHFPVVLADFLLACSGGELELKAITSRWKLSNEEVRMTASAVSSAPLISISHTLAWSQVQPIVIDRDIETILAVARDWTAAHNLDPCGIERIEESLGLSSETLNPPPLLTGNDLAKLGIRPGPAYAKILAWLRNAQLDGEITTIEGAVEAVKSKEGFQ